jgi:hypothetical protein
MRHHFPGDIGIKAALDPDGLSDVSTIDWDRDLDGEFLTLPVCVIVRLMTGRAHVIIYDDVPSLLTVAECLNDAGDDVDDIGVLHGVMAAAGFGVAVTSTAIYDAGAAGGGGRRGREKSVLDPSWRLRYNTCHFTCRFFCF